MNNPHHFSDHFASVVECNLNENITYSLRLVRDFDEKCVSINVINHSDISIWWFWVFLGMISQFSLIRVQVVNDRLMARWLLKKWNKLYLSMFCAEAPKILHAHVIFFRRLPRWPPGRCSTSLRANACAFVDAIHMSTQGSTGCTPTLHSIRCNLKSRVHSWLRIVIGANLNKNELMSRVSVISDSANRISHTMIYEYSYISTET